MVRMPKPYKTTYYSVMFVIWRVDLPCAFFLKVKKDADQSLSGLSSISPDKRNGRSKR